ncbi:Flp pilus assembly protein CpaB [Anatilimnocola sp. NA78]|uniref:Flp pilus assembly protein CpaB n=1 Tax=Anatilimnocola sp. NA78 TaxID=3415683 RepID=UPI003CE52C70
MKRISPATVTFGLMAIVLGLVAAYIVKQAMHKPVIVQKPPVIVPQPVDPGVRVVVARVNTPMNARLQASDLMVLNVPRNSPIVKGTMSFTNLAEGRITKQPIKAGQAIRDEYLLGVGEGLPDLAERLPAGMRAVTVAVQGAEAGGKRLTEGDHVDVSLTVEGTHPDLGEVATRTLLRNVLVVDAAAGKPTTRGARTRDQREVSTLTLAVGPAEANKLIVAQRTGSLTVNLVAAADVQAPALDANDAITRRQLLGLKEIVPPAPVVPARKFTVEKWSGGSLRVLEMSDDRVREARDVTTQTKPVVAPPAPTADLQTSYIPSGVVDPGVVTFESIPADPTTP